MTRETILRPGEFGAATIHPDQMILFPSGPTLAAKPGAGKATLTGHLPSPQLFVAVAAFAVGFVAGQMTLGFLY